MTAFEQLTIETPEQIALEFPLAGVGSRFLALAIDTLAQVAIGLALLLAAAGASSITSRVFEAGGPWVFAVVIIALFSIYYGYYAIFEILWQGQTPGKRLLHLRVISASGRPMSAYQALLRNLLRIVDQLPGLYGVGIISVLVTSRSQRLGDLAASTVVVHEQASDKHAVLMPPVTSGPAPGVDRLRANRLTPQELALIELFLQRRRDLDVAVRERNAHEIATRIRERLELPAGGSDEDLLERVATDYRTFGQYR